MDSWLDEVSDQQDSYSKHANLVATFGWSSWQSSYSQEIDTDPEDLELAAPESKRFRHGPSRSILPGASNNRIARNEQSSSWDSKDLFSSYDSPRIGISGPLDPNLFLFTRALAPQLLDQFQRLVIGTQDPRHNEHGGKVVGLPRQARAISGLAHQEAATS